MSKTKIRQTHHPSAAYLPIEDYAPIGDLHTVALVGTNGSIDWCCLPRFDSPSIFGALLDAGKGGFFRSKSLCLSLASPLPLEQNEQGGAQATFTLRKGQSVHFVLESAKERDHVPSPLSESHYQAAFQETLRYWRDWLAQCTYQGRWRGMVQRSALVLKLLTYAPTGAIVAAPTTSLPETMGGARNWDYRYTWVRDASFTLDSLLKLGFTQEAEAFMSWLDARCHELKENGALQPMYGINGEHELTEQILDHLEGYRQSKPVRIGNGAYSHTNADLRASHVAGMG